MWCHDNGLIINANKTKVMHIRPTHLGNANNVKIVYRNFCTRLPSVSDCDIEQVKTYKYLGVIVDENLKWHKHIDNIQNKIRSASFALRHLRYCSTPEVLKVVYHSLVESHLRFGITAWGTSTHCSRLQRSQDKILKMLENKDEYLNINSLFKLITLTEFFNLQNFRQPITHQHGTRWSEEGRFKVPPWKNWYGISTLECQIPRICNELPVDVLRGNSGHTWKKKLKVHLLQAQKT